VGGKYSIFTRLFLEPDEGSHALAVLDLDLSVHLAVLEIRDEAPRFHHARHGEGSGGELGFEQSKRRELAQDLGEVRDAQARVVVAFALKGPDRRRRILRLGIRIIGHRDVAGAVEAGVPSQGVEKKRFHEMRAFTLMDGPDGVDTKSNVPFDPSPPSITMAPLPSFGTTAMLFFVVMI